MTSNKMLFLTKRRKFILSSVVLSLGLIFIQFGNFGNRYLLITILSFLSIPLTLWSLKGALRGPVWLFSWVLPAFFTAGIGFFYFLLPQGSWYIIPIIILYLLGVYALLLSENIFSVAAIRTIQLLRSASAVSFFLTLFTGFILYDTVFSFKLASYYNFILVFLISFFLFLHGTWSVKLDDKIDFKLILFSFVFSLGIGETAFILSFWPSAITLISLFLTSLIYVCLGISQAKLNDRLFPKTIQEYLVVGSSVLVILYLYTTWG